MEQPVSLSASLMCMDLLEIRSQVEFFNRCVQFYHVDIMDGHFVPNIALSTEFVKALSRIARQPIDCHLMVTNPEHYIDALAAAGAEYICPHAETIENEAFRVIHRIEALGCKAGVVLSPSTPLCRAQHYLPLLDKLTIMTVDPGFAGQPYVKEMVEKIREANRLKEEHQYRYLIEVDGSCNEQTYGELYEAGARSFVLGSTGLFRLDDDLEVAWDKMSAIFQEKTGVCLAGQVSGKNGRLLA